MKKVAHRIHKNRPWLTPVERLVQLVLDQPNFSCPVGPSSLNNRETLILRNAHCSAPKRLPYGVAVIATLAALLCSPRPGSTSIQSSLFLTNSYDPFWASANSSPGALFDHRAQNYRVRPYNE